MRYLDMRCAGIQMNVHLLLYARGDLDRPHRWSEGEGHFAIEIAATPEGVVGKSTHGAAQKAKRPVAAILKYLTLWNDHVLEAFPPGKTPPVEEVTLRTEQEMEPYLREPLSKGWKPVYALPRIGQGTEV